MDTEKAKVHFGNFAAQWLTTDAVIDAPKDALLFPKYTKEVRLAMAQEVREIFTHVLFDDSASFSELYNSNYTFVNEVLADFYGIPGVTGSDFEKVVIPERGGLITSGAFLSAWSSPTDSKLIIRGVRLRERFLCQHLPPFPSNVDLDGIRKAQADKVAEIKADNDGDIRQSHLDYITTDVDACKGCHEYIINPLGVGLEDFDAVGLPRTEYSDNKLSVDFQGFEPEKAAHNSTFYGINDIDDSTEFRTFQGAKELGEIFAGEDVAKACLIEMGFRYMMGTGPDEFDHDDKTRIVMADDELIDYECVSSAMMAEMENQLSPKAAFVKMGLSDIVRFRKQRNR